MAESEKRALYANLARQLEGLVDSLGDPVAAMATTSSLIHENVPYSSWTGFYRVVAPGLLRVGPYQGPVACLEVEFGKGVCGTAAATGESQVVPDVHAFPGHIACDARARSEVVVPVSDSAGKLVAVLDLDSHAPASFDQEDRQGLERLIEILRPCL